MEINDNHAGTLNLMGVISFHLGEDQDAYDFFKKAMSADSTHLPTRLKLLTL